MSVRSTIIIRITVPGIIVVVILFWAFSALPNETTTDTKSAINNAKESYATDKVVDVGQKVIEQTSNQAIDLACNNGPSQACSTTYSSIAITSIAWGILVIGLVVAGVIGFARWLITMF